MDKQNNTKNDKYPQRHVFRQWVKDAMSKAKVTTLRQVSVAVGLAPGTLATYFQVGETHKPGVKTMKKLADYLDRDYRLLLALPERNIELVPPDVRADEYYVPYYSTRPAAGNGNVAEAEDIYVTKTIPVSKQWLREAGVTPADAVVFNIEGDSMMPRLVNGDLVYVDKGALAKGFKDGIWLIQVDEAIMVKQVQQLGSGQLQVTSANPAYSPFTLNKDDDFQLIGRVFYRGSWT